MSCARRRYRSSALTALSRTSLSLDASAWPNLGVGPERAASSGRGRDEVGEAFAGAFFLPIPCVRRVRHVADVFATSTRAGSWRESMRNVGMDFVTEASKIRGNKYVKHLDK